VPRPGGDDLVLCDYVSEAVANLVANAPAVREQGRTLIDDVTTAQLHLRVLTHGMESHPQYYDGPCWCQECHSYGAQD
jgi:hypothetical protein